VTGLLQQTHQVRELAWTVDHEVVRRMTPEGLYGRRKMTALVQRTPPMPRREAWIGR
jgi:hypothetical protein